MRKIKIIYDEVTKAIRDCRRSVLEATEQELSESPRWNALRTRLLKYFGDRGMQGRVNELFATEFEREEAHDDRTPSLSISESGGTILFFCHAGCSQSQVLDALKARGLFGRSGVGSRPESRLNAEGKKADTEMPHIAFSEIELLHRDLTESDRQYLKTERLLTDDSINQYKLGTIGDRISIPIETTQGMYSDVRRYLRKERRLSADIPKILHYKKGYGAARMFPIDQLQFDSVLLCEGEMDTLAAISHGFNAITTTAGAGTWTDDNSKALSGKKVTIVMDKDQAGEMGAELRAKGLATYGCQVRIAQWPAERPIGHDVTDELKFHGAESLKNIIEASVPSKLEGGQKQSLICLADVEAEEIEWLWHPYIPIGKATMIEGDPGLGKSWILLAIAKHVACGSGLPGVAPCQSGNVLLMSAEDGLGDTIKPRLTSMGADDSKIFAPREVFTFDGDGISILERYIQEIRPRLITIDPLVSYMGGKIDMNRANETRQLMTALGSLASSYHCALLLLRHLTKASAEKSIYRGMGSIDLTGACRSVLLVGADSNNRDNRALIHIKCNIAKMGSSQGYVLDDGHFRWTGESMLTAADILKAEASSKKSNSSLEEAKDFLETALQLGDKLHSEIDEEAEGQGISKITLNRAKKALGVIAVKKGEKGSGRGKGCWIWKLPKPPHRDLGAQHYLDAQEVRMENLSTLIDGAHYESFDEGNL